MKSPSDPTDGLVIEGPRERIHFYRPSALPDVELLLLEGTTRLWRAFHETYTLSFVPERGNEPEGGCDWIYRDEGLRLRPGGVAFMEPGELHVTTRIRVPTDCYVLMIDPERVSEVADDLGLGEHPHFRSAQTHHPKVASMLQGLCTVLRHGTALEQETSLSEALRFLLERYGERAPARRRCRDDRPVSRARDYLHAHVADPVSLRDLSRIAGVSRFHLVRSFARAYGIAPHAYQIQLRLAAAREEIRKGAPLGRVSVEAGFCDQSHLGRFFKRHVGITPGEFALGY